MLTQVIMQSKLLIMSWMLSDLYYDQVIKLGTHSSTLP